MWAPWLVSLCLAAVSAQDLFLPATPDKPEEVASPPRLLGETKFVDLRLKADPASTGNPPTSVPAELAGAAPVKVTAAETVIVYIADGPLAQSSLFSGALESLGKHGLWKGPVIIISDRAECIQEVQEPRAKSVGLDLTIVATDRRRDLIAMKLQKAEVWFYVQQAGYGKMKQVIYIDEDILIGYPVQKFIDLLNSPQHRSHPVVMFKNPNPVTNFPHGGLMVTRRGDAAITCLNQWAFEMISQRRARRKRWEYDQPALNRTNCRVQGKIHILPTGWEDGFFAWPYPDDLAAHKKAVFMHFTNNKKMKRSDLKKPIKAYFSQDLGLSGDPYVMAKCSIKHKGSHGGKR